MSRKCCLVFCCFVDFRFAEAGLSSTEGSLIMALFWWLLRGVFCMFYGLGEVFMVRLENV